MRLLGKQEWIAIAVAIALVVFGPRMELSAPLHKVAVLAVIAYVWKSVSPVVAGILILWLVLPSSSTWEHMENKNCACPEGYTLNISTQKCVDDKDSTKTQDPRTGYVWDDIAKTCKPSQPTVSAPVPVPTASISTTTAPATGTGTGANTSLPMTTGAAAAQTMLTTPPTPPPSTGVVSGSTTSTPASVV